jgi:protein-S-isoprenylcysteine O-methyltransferase Ste14
MGIASGLIQPLIELVGQLADKYGTKFLVALGAIGGLVWLTHSDKLAGEWAAVGIVLIACLYMVFRRKQEEQQLEVKK